MSAETLRRAAALMRERARAADDAWNDIVPFVRPGNEFEAHAQSWSPAVALAVAEGCEVAADAWDDYVAAQFGERNMRNYPWLAVARAYLGES